MVLDSFRNLNIEEVKKKVDEWFFDLEYLDRLRVLLRVYEKLNVTKIEDQGVAILWRKIDLERQKDIYQGAWRYQR